MLTVRDLTYSYPAADLPSLRSLDTQLPEGAMTLLVGPNGAGKSTLALALAGFIPHHYGGEIEGDVFLDGQSMRRTSLGAWVTRVGMVFQNPFNQITGARLTVFEEIAFGLENLGVPRDEMVRRVETVLELLDIAALADRSPYALSGGQQQRVAIASILVLAPDVLVLDEPTAQLDPQGSAEVLRLLEGLSKQGTTAVLATHQLAQAAPFADGALLLARGRILCEGPARTILSDSQLDDLGVARPAPARLAERLGLPAPWPVTVAGAAPLFRAVLAERAPVPGAMAEPESVVTGDDPVVAEAPPTVVDLENVTFTYPGGVRAVDNVSLSLAPGTITVLAGENGAGKTTLSKLINGLLPVSSGAIHINDWHVAEYRASDLAAQVGYVFQNPNDQLFKSTVWDEVAFGPRNLGRSRQQVEEAVVEALRLAGLSEAVDVHPYDLQLAERRWVAIASVLAMQTPVVIFDEPTTGQDGHGLRRLSRLMRALRRAGRTLLVITHDMECAAEIADRMVVMAGGQILAGGSPAQIFADEALLDRAAIEAPATARLAEVIGLGSGVVTPEQFLRAWLKQVELPL